MLSCIALGQSVCYFKVVNIDNGKPVINVLALTDSKKCTITKTDNGVFKVVNLKNKQRITFSAENFGSKYHFRPKKKHEIARDLCKMFVLHDNDTMIIQLLPNDVMLEQIWDAEDADYGIVDTTNCIEHPENEPYLKDSLMFFNAINRNIKYPQQAIEQNLQGKVLIGAVVEIDGSITNVHIIKSVDRFLDRAGLRAVRNAKLPLINPAIHDGEVVRCVITMPITFTLK